MEENKEYDELDETEDIEDTEDIEKNDETDTDETEILRSLLGFAPKVESELKPVVDQEKDYIVLGRSGSEHEELNGRGLMDIGVVGESQTEGTDHLSRRIMVDSQFPHIIFICGKRGSGKSYTLGIFAEELAKSSESIGTVLIDPIGIFWSLKRENVSKKEKQALDVFGLFPVGFENVKVLTPLGYEAGMEAMLDDSFSIGVSEMTAADWCTVFDLDRFKSQGLLISDVIDKVRKGYIALYGNLKIEMGAKGERFSIGDIIQCIEHDEDFQSKIKGYAASTRRSIAARFHAVGNWGLFSMVGTPLQSITSPNQVTVIDVSHPKIDNDKRALIVGILARKILEGRIQASKREEARGLGMQISMEGTLPVTWLLIDEAHLILPKGRESAATKALTEYAKLGRKPGCALVLATQRPAATDDSVLSQVDMMISHNLALEEDMVSLRKRLPAKVPPSLITSDFIRSIPIGMGLLADQKTQNRAMLVKFRPRQSYHSGRAAVPTSITAETNAEETEYRAAAAPVSHDDGKGSILIPSLNIEQLLIKMDGPSSDEEDKKGSPVFVFQDGDLHPKGKAAKAKKTEDGKTEDETEKEIEEKGSKEKAEEAEGEDGKKVKDRESTEKASVRKSGRKKDEKDDKKGEEDEDEKKETGKKDIKGESKEDKPKNKKVTKDIDTDKKGDKGKEKGAVTDKKKEVEVAKTAEPEIDKTKEKKTPAEGIIDREISEELPEEEPLRAELPEILREVLARGHHYLFKNKDKSLSRDFVREIKDLAGIELMVISRAPSSRVEKLFEGRVGKAYWLSKTGKKDSLNPHNLEKISFTISSFLGRNRGSMIYFDGLEYLISNNDFHKVMRFIETVHENCQLSEGVAIFPFTPEVITKRDMTQLQTEMDVTFEKEDMLPFSKESTEVETEPEVKVDDPIPETKADDPIPETKVDDSLPDRGEVSWDEEEGTEETKGVVEAKEAVERMEAQPSMEEKEDGKGGSSDDKADVPETQQPGGLDLDYYADIIARRGRERKRTDETGARGTKVIIPSHDMKQRQDWPDIRLKDQYLKKSQSSAHVTDRDIRKIRVPLTEPVQIMDAEFTEIPREDTAVPAAHRDPEEERIEPEIGTRLSDVSTQTRMSLIQKELEKTSGTDDAAIEKIIETEFMTEGKGHLVILPAIREEEAEEEARGHLEGEGMFKRKKIEMVSEINLTFIPLIRMFFSRMSGFISKKRKVYTLFFDAVTGELVTKYRKGLRRTQNISVLFDYPKTQVAVLLVMRRITALSDIELRAKSELRAQDLKSALNSLEKKGMVHRQVSSDGFYKYKRTIDISSPAHLHKATPDMPYIREGRLIVEAVKQRFKPKDVEKLMKGLADDLTLVDHDIVHYPYYIASVEGKRGPRKIFIDGINGGEDELLGTILNLKMEIPK